MQKKNRKTRQGAERGARRRRSLAVANRASPGEARQWSEELLVLRKPGKLLTELTGSTKKLNLAVKVQYLG